MICVAALNISLRAVVVTAHVRFRQQGSRNVGLDCELVFKLVRCIIWLTVFIGRWLRFVTDALSANDVDKVEDATRWYVKQTIGVINTFRGESARLACCSTHCLQGCGTSSGKL